MALLAVSQISPTIPLCLQLGFIEVIFDLSKTPREKRDRNYHPLVFATVFTTDFHVKMVVWNWRKKVGM